MNKTKTFSAVYLACSGLLGGALLAVGTVAFANWWSAYLM